MVMNRVVQALNVVRALVHSILGERDVNRMLHRLGKIQI